MNIPSRFGANALWSFYWQCEVNYSTGPTYEFARCVRTFVKKLPRTITNNEDIKQVVRSSGSVGANYIEANESLGKKDFKMRIRISRKESKETSYWLRLLDTQDDPALNAERGKRAQESTELMRIFGAILQKSK